MEGIRDLLGANIGSLDSKVKYESQSQLGGLKSTDKHAISRDRTTEEKLCPLFNKEGWLRE